MAVILLSGGLDSAVNLALAHQAELPLQALTIDYGQKSAARELTAARELSEYYRIPWRSLDLQWLGTLNRTSLTNSAQEIPHVALAQLDDRATVENSRDKVWVSNRNGVFLNVAAALAESTGETEILVGFNAEEAATFPDNSPEYLEAVNRSLQYSTLTKVKGICFTIAWDKKTILKKALELELPLQFVWSCYEGGAKRCWNCESCRRTERALRDNGALGIEWLAKMGGK